MSQDEKIIAFPTAQAAETVIDEEAEIETTEEEETALLNLKAKKYTLTPEQIAEYGEELAKKKQEQLDFLFQLRQEVTQSRAVRAEKLASMTDKERYAFLKQEEKESKARRAWGRQLAKVQKDKTERDMAKALMEEIKKGIADGSIQVPAKKREGKARKRKKK